MKKLSQAFQAKKYLRTILPLCAFLLVSASLLAQARTVTGTLIDDATGEALIGASVIVKGSTVGTVTDFDGTFSLEAAPGDVLVVSYVGYADQEIVVGNQSNISVNMSQGILVDEVVVTGYQSQRKRDITGAVSIISSDDLNVTPAASLSQKLAGRAPGLTTTTSGAPGDGTQILIRGINSFSNNDPLIVIDGVPTKDTYLNSINPNDIESIQVLKDAASSTIYGARSSNGVIIVTTKKGKAGKPRVNYNAYTGVQNAVNRFDLANAQEFFDYMKVASPTIDGGVYEGSSYPEYYFGDPSQPYNFDERNSDGNPVNHLMKSGDTDWWDAAISSAPINEHNLNVSGGTENSTYSITGNYFNQQGTIDLTYFERFIVRANTSFKAGRLTVGENLSVSRINQVGQASGNQSEQNVITNIVRIQPFVPVYDESGVNFAGPKGNLAGLGNNPVKKMYDDKDDVGNYNRLFGNVFAQIDLIDGLFAKTSLGADYGNGFRQDATFPNFEAREINQRIFNYSETWNTNFSWTWTNTLNFVKQINNRNSINAIVGYEAYKQVGREIGGGLADYFVFETDSRYLDTGLGDNDSRDLNSNGFAESYTSSFAKVDYTYDDWVLLSGTVRRDGSSKFAPDFRYGVFPAGSIGLRLSKFLNVDAVDDLKVRFSYGINGNDAINPYNQYELFGGNTSNAFYAINGSNNGLSTGYALQTRSNEFGKWEELKQSNFGIDATLLNGKVGLVLDVFSKNTVDLLFEAELPGTAGTASPAFVNIANMKNTGFDASLFYRDRIGSGLGFNASLTLGRYKNEITKVTNSQTQFSGNGGSRVGAISINRVGDPVGSYFGYETDGLFQSQQEVDAHATQLGAYVGGLRFRDLNNDGEINDMDRTIIGDYHPDLTAGLNLGFDFKGIDVSAFLFGSFGGQIYNLNKIFHDFSQFEANVTKEVATNYWTPENSSSTIPFPSLNGRINNTQASDYFVEDATYVRLANLQIGYKLPDNLGFFSGQRIYLQGTNLFTITDYSGLDPAMSNFGRSVTEAGVDFGNYPSNRVLQAGINLTF